MATSNANAEAGPSTPPQERPMRLEEYERYGRQMILPGWGLPGQLKLRSARVAVVGAGGLGCPVLQYLAGAGVGKAHRLLRREVADMQGQIDIFDHDTVSASNLHRQVLHTSDRVGMNKAESAARAMTALNPFVQPIPHPEPITSSNALDLLRPAQIIVDCTDRPLTRYLLSDASVRLGVPLVSGAAISSAGQWAVYGGVNGSGPKQEPAEASQSDRKGKRRACYRCIWPSVLPGSNGRCEDVGVWGVVTGIVGTGMAGEVLKLILGNDDDQPLLHLLHLGQSPLIRTIRLKPPSPKCIACGPDATITDDLDAVGYDAFCGGADVDGASGLVPGSQGERISAEDLCDIMLSRSEKTLVVDTRSEIEYEICAVPKTKNISLSQIIAHPLDDIPLAYNSRVIFLCKQGNDSQVAAAAVRRALQAKQADGAERRDVQVTDVRGGLRAWSRRVDPSFPLY